MAKYLALDKLANFFRIIRQNGGPLGCVKKLYIQDTLKDGRYVGIDEFGNKYFENYRYFFGRSRWVEYSPKFHLDYDASQVPAEWFGWLHYKTDILPCCDCSRPRYCWMEPHTENLSGTCGQYVPYSTTKPKVQPWNPNPSPCECKCE